MERGRPSKLTPELQQKLVDAIRTGNYYSAACAYAGVSYKVFRDWMIRGEAQESGKYCDFRKAITRAESEAEVRTVALWQKAIPEDWRAAQMFLERRHPDRWGKREKVEHGGGVSIDHGIAPDEFNAVLAALGYDPLGGVASAGTDEVGGGNSTPTADPDGEPGPD